MARVKSIAQKRHRKIFKLAKGYKQARGNRVKAAKEAILHAGQYAYAGRKLRKRDLRALWIERINAGARMEKVSYSKFIAGLKKEKIEIDRKILSDIAISDPATFKEIVSSVK
ncbi:MAG: 50S ribosomal protein L20 [Patescibacteria group bacterium]